MRTLAGIALTLAAALGAAPAHAQNSSAPPSPPPVASTDVGNWGFLTFSFPEPMSLTPAAKAEIRALEDRQLAERRALEDRFEAELRALRARQAQERSELVASLPKQ
jgi:Spy/CpxP family protein refolding chaperone